MTFLEFAKKVLLEENKPLKYLEIWEIAEKKKYTSQINAKGKTPWHTMGFVNV